VDADRLERAEQFAAIIALRGLGQREAEARLEMLSNAARKPTNNPRRGRKQ
jgi:hypothetical protein